MLQAIEGYYVDGYTGADKPSQPLGLVPGAVEQAEEVLASNVETQHRFQRVAALVNGFETPHGLELLATVHWVVKRECPGTKARWAIRLRQATEFAKHPRPLQRSCYTRDQ